MSSVLIAEPSEPLYLNSFCIGYRLHEANSFEPDFIKHLLRSSPLRRQIVGTANGVTRFNVSKPRLAKGRVPIPPLEVQREIVRVVNLFLSLEAELEARRRQYAHYRDALVSIDIAGEWATLDDVCKAVRSGSTPLATRAEYYGGAIPWLRTQEVRYADVVDTDTRITDAGLANSAANWIPANSVIVAISGAGVTRGRVAINKIPLTTNQHCCSLVIDPAKAHYRFVYHWLTRQYDDLRSRGQGNRSDLNMGIVKAYPIPLPTMDEQERIAALLDRFDALVNDLSSGLPAELAARRKQYEHYRNKLLTFEEAV